MGQTPDSQHAPARRGLLVTALVLAVVSGVSAAGAGSSTPDTRLRSAADAGPTGETSSPVQPAGPLTLPATPVVAATPEPADAAAVTGLAANGIPNVALNAYRVAAGRMNAAQPGCGIDWSLLAGIGRVESNHGRFGGAELAADGTSTPRIVGPALDGAQFAFIADSDDGRWDGDAGYDRAVGPMQFIPTTWRAYEIDADADGTADPLDIDDAALAAAHYLCVAGGDLTTDAGRRRAVLAYNHSDSYVDQVLALAAAYAAGIPVADLPLRGDTTGPVPAPSGNASGPAAPGPAIGARDTTPSPAGQAAVVPAAPVPAAAAAAPAPAPADDDSSTGGGTTTTGTGAGSGSGSAGSGSGSGGNTGGGSGGLPVPAPTAAPAPAAPTPQLPVPVPVPTVDVPVLPPVLPLPVCLPHVLPSLQPACQPG